MKLTITSKHPQTRPTRTHTLKVELMGSPEHPIEGSCELWINGQAYILSAKVEGDFLDTESNICPRTFFITKNPDKTRTVFRKQN